MSSVPPTRDPAGTSAPGDPTHRSEHFVASGPIRLELRNLAGDVTVTTTPGTDVRVTADGHGRDGEALVAELRFTFAGDRLTIDSPRVHGGTGATTEDMPGVFEDVSGSSSETSGSVRGAFRRLGEAVKNVASSSGNVGIHGSVDLTVSVPDGSRVSAHDGAGDIHVDGTTAEVTARTGAGKIEIAGVHGPTQLTTGAGDIGVTARTEDLHAKSGAGDLTVGTVDGTAELTTGMGDVRVDRAVSGSVHARTGMGSLSVDVAEGTAADLDLGSGMGDKRVDLTPQDGAPLGGRTVRIELSSGMGNVHVGRARS